MNPYLTPYRKNQLTMDRNPNVQAKIMTLFTENTGINLRDLELGNSFSV